MPPTDFPVQDVEWANGACLMIRKALFDRLGGLDERFFIISKMSIFVVAFSSWAIVSGMWRRVVVHLLGRAAAQTAGLVSNGSSVASAIGKALCATDGF